MIPKITISDVAPDECLIQIRCKKEDLAKFKGIIASSFGAMKGAVDVRNLMQGGLTQIFDAVKMMGAKK